MKNLIVGFSTLVGTICLTIFTMIRCHNHWQYLLLAIERLGISVVISFITISATLATWHGAPDTHRAFSGFIYYFVMTFANILGAVGYLALLVENWKNPAVRVAWGSGAAVLGVVVGGALFVIPCCCNYQYDERDMLLVTIAIHFFAIAVGDWVLGAIAGNIAGNPDGKVKVLYWLYFGFKRLPMLWS